MLVKMGKVPGKNNLLWDFEVGMMASEEVPAHHPVLERG